MSKYLHGNYTNTANTDMTEVVQVPMAQVVIGTAPVHMLDDPSLAVNVPVLCESLQDCREKIGYSTDFKKFTLCASMYVNFSVFGVGPVVFINVLDPEKHKTNVPETEKQVNDNQIVIDDDIIVSTLKITKEESTAIDKFDTMWLDGKLYVNFEEKQEGTVKVTYDKVDPNKVKNTDIIGSVDKATGKRSGCEVIKHVFPKLGVTPFLYSAPGWTTDDTVTAILKEKVGSVNGCYHGVVIADIDTDKATTIEKVIEEKKGRAFDENTIAVWPMVKYGEYIIPYSAIIGGLIMSRATNTDGITCESPSNKRIPIEGAVLKDGTPVDFDQEDGNELNAEGIVTIISRNGFYAWGNNTAIYPSTTDPVKRWIMTRLSFLWIENDFINSTFGVVDGPIGRKAIESAITDYNIKLASYANKGYIVSGRIEFKAADNPVNDMLKGHFKQRAPIAANIPMEAVETEFSYDVNALQNSLFGGEQ